MTAPTEGSATCPRCGSTTVQAVPVKRADVRSARAARYLPGTAGAVAAASGTVIQADCLKCGCRWFPGTIQEEELRVLSGQRGEPARQAGLEAKKRKALEKARAAVVVLSVIIIVIMGMVTVLATK